MEQVLYDLMDWAGIEELVYSEGANPRRLLGPHMTDDGLLIQALIPTAQAISVKLMGTGKKYPMELADEAGFFAALIPRKNMTAYTLVVTFDNGVTKEFHDPYSFGSQYTEADIRRFQAGIHYEIYNKMGAHPMTVNGVEGVYFSVWAPCAMRVSVVGDFNLWDGRRHPMELLGDSGIFELFIPELKAGQIYKYEIKTGAGLPMLKADPYGNFAELRPDTASVVWDLNSYSWGDRVWMEQRAKSDKLTEPMSVYEVHLGSWKRRAQRLDDKGEAAAGSEFYNYREIAEQLAAYVKDMGYTHVELLPVMEHPLDASWGYQVTGYYAPTSRYGTPDDFMYFMDYMHKQGIGVILDWVPAHFPRDAHGLACFDGTCVYEHKDPRQGSHPHWGTLIYNYGRPGVCNFLIANALFWADQYHADGIRMDAVASMLYLDYGKKAGEWVPNIYGSNENLEAVEFLKQLSTAFKGRKDGAVLVAEESTAWPRVTEAAADGGLGFDFKWNMGWMNDFTNYMRCDPFFRKNHYGELTFSMLYAYSENFMLVFSHDEVVHGKGSMIGKMPGETLEEKAENLRAAYGFMLSHPGKKLLFMGQEFAQVAEWNEETSLDWDLLEIPAHKGMQEYVKALNILYSAQPALYAMDYDPDGFQWVNCTYQQESMIVFLRKTKKREETLLVVCNFDNVSYDKFRVGVPFAGRYKEILNSDAEEFGGSGRVNPRARTAKEIEWDELEYSIEIKAAPMSVSIFSCTPDVTVRGGRQGAGKKPAAEKAARGLSAARVGQKKLSAAKKGKKLAADMEGKKKLVVAVGGQKKLAAAMEGQKKLSVGAEEQERLSVGAEEQKRLSTAKEDRRKLSTAKTEQKKLATAKTEQKKLSTAKEEQQRLSTAKEEQQRLSTAKEEQQRLSTAKEEQQRLSTAKEKQQRLSTAKEEQQKLSTAKEEQQRLSTAKEEQQRLSTAKEKQQRLSTAKEEQQRLSTAKEKQQRLSTAKEEQQRLSTAKEKQQRLSTAKTEQKKLPTVKENLKTLSAAKTEHKTRSAAETETGKLSSAEADPKQPDETER